MPLITSSKNAFKHYSVSSRSPFFNQRFTDLSILTGRYSWLQRRSSRAPFPNQRTALSKSPLAVLSVLLLPSSWEHYDAGHAQQNQRGRFGH